MSSNDEPKPADKAWITMHKEMVKTTQLHQFAKDYVFWRTTDEGKTGMKEHEDKVKFIREKLSKEHIKSLTQEELLECYSKLYATSNINAHKPFFEKNVIKANGGFDYVKKELTELLHGEDEIEVRYEKGIANIKQFADSTISELINNIYPDRCCMWNDMVLKAIPILGLEKLIPKKILNGKTVRLAADYKKCNELMSYVMEEVSSYGITNFYLLDSLFWYTASRLYWRIQPGEGGENWDEQQKNKIIGVSWDIKEDLSQVEDISEVVIKYRKKKSGQSKVSKQLKNFRDVVQIGDFVVANNGFSEILGVGKVTSEYHYNPEFEDFSHIRDIDWFDVSSKIIPKQDWARITINKITRETFEAITEKQASPVYITSQDPLLKKFSKILTDKKQIVLYGPPGTGKTFFAKRLASTFYSNEFLDSQDPDDTFQFLQKAGFTDLIQFHPSYSYEDFVEGIRPKLNKDSNQLDYKVQDGIFKKFCVESNSIYDEYDHYFALISNYVEIEKPKTASELGLSQSFGGGMNEISKDNFKKILDHLTQDIEDTPEGFEQNNFSAFFRLNTKENSKYGDRDGIRYHFSEYAHSWKKFLTAIQTGDVAIAYHDRERDGFIGIGIIKKNNYIQNPKFVLIIDEINRGNLSKIFGELIYGLEYRDTPIKTQYSEFDDDPSFLKIPKNLLIIGTMNTADRSISLFDTALRRRFAFIELLPDYDLLVKQFEISEDYVFEEVLKKLESDKNNVRILSVLSLDILNQEILNNIQLGREKQIGHSYLIPLASDQSKFYNIWRYEIIPLLEEFYYAESETLENILGKNIFDKNYGIQDFERDELIVNLTKLVKHSNG